MRNHVLSKTAKTIVCQELYVDSQSVMPKVVILVSLPGMETRTMGFFWDFMFWRHETSGFDVIFRKLRIC